MHTPLTIVEHHPHQIKYFPSTSGDELDGVDAAVSEGWLDLKVKNNTNLTFQIEIYIDGPYINGRIFMEQGKEYFNEVISRERSFFKKAVIKKHCRDY